MLVGIVKFSKALSTSSGGTTGQVVSALSPAGAYAIGQYFKNNDSLNNKDGGNRAGEGSTSHLLAHGLLALAVGSATGQSPETITTTTLSTMGAEALAPKLGKYLYGTDKVADLTAEQKQTISNVLGTAGLVAGVVTAQATGVDSISSVSAGQQVQSSVQNAVENNRQLHPNEIRFILNDDRVKVFADKYGLSIEEAKKELMQTALAYHDAEWEKIYDLKSFKTDGVYTNDTPAPRALTYLWGEFFNAGKLDEFRPNS